MAQDNAMIVRMAVLEAKFDELARNQAANMAQLQDQLISKFGDMLKQHVAEVKPKAAKKVAATENAPPTDEKAAVPPAKGGKAKPKGGEKKVEHHTLKNLPAGVWTPKKGTGIETITPFLIALRREYPATFSEAMGKDGVGAAITEEVQALPEIKAVASGKPQERASKFVETLWVHLAKSGRVESIGNVLMAYYNAQRAAINSQKIDQVVPESKTAAEVQG